MLNILLPLLLLNSAHAAGIAATAQDVRPIAIGQKIPSVKINTLEGKEVDLAAEMKGTHTILVFYRGGWCPYCNLQLAALGGLKDQLNDLGWKMMAISPDRPELLAETKNKHKLDYRLYSDSGCNAARALGLAFTIDDSRLKKLKSYGIDLLWASGQKQAELPVPAVYLVGADGAVLFQYANPDYKIRLDGDVLLAAATAYGPK